MINCPGHPRHGPKHVFDHNFLQHGHNSKLKDQSTFQLYMGIGHRIHFRTVSFQLLLSTFLIQFKLVYGPFRQNNMHSRLCFCPRPAKKETNLQLRKKSDKLIVQRYVQWQQQHYNVYIKSIPDQYCKEMHRISKQPKIDL